MSSLRGAHQYRTVCEVLREILDAHQGTDEHSIEIRKKLAEAEDMAKRMSRKLLEYNQVWDKAFWEKNPDYAEDLRRRLDERYVVP